MERCQVTIAGKAIWVNLTASENAVSVSHPGIYSEGKRKAQVSLSYPKFTNTHMLEHTHFH